MRVELFLDEGEEYPEVFSVWSIDPNTGRADLTTRRNYVDDKKGWDRWRKTEDENARLKAENDNLRVRILDMWSELNGAVQCYNACELGADSVYVIEKDETHD